MRAGEAVARAAEAVLHRWSGHPAFRGAFLAGSVTDLGPDDEVPTTSDVDLTVVLAGTTGGRRKRRVGELVVETTLLDVAELSDPRQVARIHWLAPSFRGGQLVADPGGLLRRLEDVVAPTFAEPDAVLARVDHVLELASDRLAAPVVGHSWPDAVLGWVFPISLPTQAPLVATLRTPTVRRRYAAARAALTGLDEVHEQLLGWLVPADVGPDAVRAGLADLARLWPEGGIRGREHLPFAADLSADARAVALHGGEELVDQGLHREAVFWTVVSAARCAIALRSVGAVEASFDDLVQDLLGVSTPGDLDPRRRRCVAGLPGLREVCGGLAVRQRSTRHLRRARPVDGADGGLRPPRTGDRPPDSSSTKGPHTMSKHSIESHTVESHTEAAGDGISDREMVETVAEQTDSASENAQNAGKDWDGDPSQAPDQSE